MRAEWYCPSWPVIRVFGPDAASWLNGIVTCSVSQALSEKATWGALLTKQGKVQNTFFAVPRGDSVYLAVTGGSAPDALSTLDGYLVMEDAEIEMSDLQSAVRIPPEGASGSDADTESQRSALSASCESLGELTRLHFLSSSQVQEMKRTLSEEAWISERTFEQHRLRLGVPWFGVDFSDADNLHVAGLERRVVDWSKGCYLGQEVVCMQEMRGKVRKRVVPLRVTLAEGATAPILPFDLLDETSQSVGSCTSLAEGYALGKVTSPHDQAGTRLVAMGAAGQQLLRAVVVS